MKREQLVDTINNAYGSEQVFAIYKLTEEQAKKYAGGKRYWLTCGQLSDYAYMYMSDDDILSRSNSSLGEGFFETEKECTLTIELYKYQNFFSSIKSAAATIDSKVKDFEKTIGQ